MKIYVCHSNLLDYEKELYDPIKKSNKLDKYEFIFPHDKKNVMYNSRINIENAEIIIAEVSFPSTGMGIELGWANDLGKEILCIYNSKSRCGRSLEYITSNFIQYNNSEDMIEKIYRYLEER